MGSVTRTKLMSVMALCAMIGLLLLPVLVAIPALAMRQQRASRWSEKRGW